MFEVSRPQNSTWHVLNINSFLPSEREINDRLYHHTSTICWCRMGPEEGAEMGLS